MRTHCRRGHLLTAENICQWRLTARLCRICHLQWKRDYYHRMKPVEVSTALVPRDRSPRAQKALATKLMRYGPTLLSDRGRLVAQENGRRNQHHPARRMARRVRCKYGHVLSGANIRLWTPKGKRTTARICKVCERNRGRMRSGRRGWLELETGRIDIGAHDQFYLAERKRLRDRLVACHPDRRQAGMSNRPAQRAARAYANFLEREKRWYAALGVEPPLPGLIVDAA